ncbi:MAG: hypothetical protein JO090_06975 [Rhizobacter sp.]|nr:hypothetical protein [Rhizobacter sp.]
MGSRTPRAAVPARAIAAALLLASCAAPAIADEATAEPSVAAPAAHARISFEKVTFPGDEKVGFVGTSYLVDVPRLTGLSLGPAVYGAITGHRGGFFTIGGELAWRQRIVGPFGVETGVYAGGGGGAGAPQGGGLMLRPHLDALYDFGSTALGISVSRVKFPNGQIASTQWGLVLNVSDEFRATRADRLDEPTRASGRSGIGFDRVQLVAGAYRPRSGSTLLDGRAMPTIGYLGARGEQSIGSNTYWGVEAAGATQSAVAGYAEFLGILGAETELVRNTFNGGIRFGLGMGGGGSVPTGGGLLVKGSLYGIFRLSNDVGLSLEAGLTSAPQGQLRAAHAGAALVWALDGPRSSGVATPPVRTEFGAGVERYDAARKDGTTREMSLATLRIDRFLSANIYLSGQAHTAFAGSAGGFTSAFLGAGWWQPLSPRWHLAAELLGGAAGGGGVDSHGAVGQAMLYAGAQLTPAVGMRLGVGRIQAMRGPLGATVVDASLVFTYGVTAGN